MIIALQKKSKPTSTLVILLHHSSNEMLVQHELEESSSEKLATRHLTASSGSVCSSSSWVPLVWAAAPKPVLVPFCPACMSWAILHLLLQMMHWWLGMIAEQTSLLMLWIAWFWLSLPCDVLHNDDNSNNSNKSALLLRLLPASASLVQGQSCLFREAYSEDVNMQQRGCSQVLVPWQKGMYALEQMACLMIRQS